MKIFGYFFLSLVVIPIAVAQDTAKFNEVLANYQADKDSLKLKAAEYLIKNMSSHESIDLIWINEEGKDTGFHELNFEDYPTALENFKILKDSISIRPQEITIKDFDIVDSNYIIKNIEAAFTSWEKYQWSRKYDFETFCKQILPYKSVIEPVQDWRKNYTLFLNDVIENLQDAEEPIEVCQALADRYKQFEYVETWNEPIPLLGPNQILFREMGSCPDFANLLVYSGRVLGLPISFDFTPHWAASSNTHFWCAATDHDGSIIPFDVYEFYLEHFNKRLGKVYRSAYEIQENSLANIVPLDSIPDGFLRSKNIKDVTDQYVKTSNVEYNFENTKKNIAYLTVYNKSEWKIVDWAHINENGKATFKSCGRNVVYLPITIANNQVIQEKYPILLSTDGTISKLQPTLKNTFDCTLSRENEKVTIFKDNNPLVISDGKNYNLFYWDKKWVKLAEAIANQNSVSFKKIPKNALLLLEPDTPSKYLRPFIINSKTSQISWF